MPASELQKFAEELDSLREEIRLLKRIETAKDFDPTNASSAIDLVDGIIRRDTEAIATGSVGLVGGAVAARLTKRLRSVAPKVGPVKGTRARDILSERLGENPYPVKSEAHHIFGVEHFDTPLGQRLHNWGIDLNSADNGVLLPKYHFEGRKASIHSGRTSGAYNEEVAKRLNEANSKDEALEILADLKKELREGMLQINKATGISKP